MSPTQTCKSECSGEYHHLLLLLLLLFFNFCMLKTAVDTLHGWYDDNVLGENRRFSLKTWMSSNLSSMSEISNTAEGGFQRLPFPREQNTDMHCIYLHKVRIRKTYIFKTFKNITKHVSAYNYAESNGCFKDLFCAKQPKCKGRIFDCQFFNADAVSFRFWLLSSVLIIGGPCRVYYFCCWNIINTAC